MLRHISVRRTKTHAFDTSGDGFNRCWAFALAGQSIHTDAGNDQIDLKRRGCHCRRIMAFKRFWTL
jgi:hypothetical protein